MHHELHKQVIEILNKKGFESRLAGGCVRDKLLCQKPKDYDIATTATPDQVTEIFKKHFFFAVVPTGLQHGTVTITKNHESVEVTTLRVDKICDGRHAEVEFTDSFELDASRRDFTINAMYEDLYGNIYDFFNGEEDLKNGVLRFVGNADDRIQEDYLRIMRYFRFAARFEMKGTLEAIEAINRHKDGLRKISQERITSELLKTLECKHAYRGVNLMRDCEIFDIILPEWNHKRPLIETSNSIIKLASMVYGITSEQAETLGRRFKLSTTELRQLVFLCTPIKLGTEPADSLDLIDRVEELFGNPNACFGLWKTSQQYMHFEQQLNTHIQSHGTRRIKSIPFSSEKIMKTLSMKPSKELGSLLKILKRAFRNGQWSSENEGLQLVQIMTYDKERLALLLIDPSEPKRNIAKLRMEQLDENN